MTFKAGQSGNPGGRPKETGEVKELARSHGKRAIEKLAALIDSDDERVAVAASEALLNRGYGKPAQAIIGGDSDDPPVRVEWPLPQTTLDRK